MSQEGLIDDVSTDDTTDTTTTDTTTTDTTTDNQFEGLPEDIIDNDAISNDKLKDYLAQRDEDKKKDEKRINDLRAKVSKKDKPENADGYFFKSEKYETIINDNENMQELMTGLKEKCHEQGMGQTEFEFVANQMLELGEKEGLIDTRSDEEVKQWKAEEKAKLGDNADEVIKSSVDFVNASKIFNEEEKDILKGLMNQGAGFIGIVNKMNRLFGDPNPIPVGNEVTSGLKSDAELWSEYSNPETTPFRCKQIIEQRAKAGRKGKLSEAKDSF